MVTSIRNIRAPWLYVFRLLNLKHIFECKLKHKFENTRSNWEEIHPYNMLMVFSCARGVYRPWISREEFMSRLSSIWSS